ncbi:MAG: endonuclease NucS [Nitrososphaerota archaeon]
MRLKEAAEKLREGIRSRSLIVLTGLMEVFYEGRASSSLGEGERLLLIKQDGSVLVHRPTGYEPVNWQPPGSLISVIVKDGVLVIEARRLSPEEILRVVVKKVYSIESHKLEDSADFAMHATEEEMKRAILLEPSLIEEGFKPIEDERRAGRAGFVDIFGVDSSGNLVVVEIKRRNATSEDVRQLVSYVKEIEKELGRRPRMILAAPGVQRSASRELAAYGVEFKCLSPKRCHEILKRGRGLEEFLG